MRDRVHDAGDVDQRDGAAGALAHLGGAILSPCGRVHAAQSVSVCESGGDPCGACRGAPGGCFALVRTSRRRKAISRNMARTGCAGLPTTSSPRGHVRHHPGLRADPRLPTDPQVPGQPGLATNHDVVLEHR